MNTRTRYQNIILILLAVITVGALALLIYNRTQPGIQFRDGYLKQQETAEYTVYFGRCKGEDTAIYVTEKADGTLVQILAGTYRWEYLVSEWEGSPTHYSGNKPVLITDVTGNERFRGYLTYDGHLTDEENHITLDSFDIYVYTEYGNKSVWDDYTPSNLFVVNVAYGQNLAYRGSIGLFAMMLLATICMAVDILFPELWFQLKHILDVRDPEPSDFYIAMQRLGWAVWPVLLAVGYGYAATILP